MVDKRKNKREEEFEDELEEEVLEDQDDEDYFDDEDLEEEFQKDDDKQKGKSELSDKTTSVAMNPKSRIFIVAIMLIIGLFTAYKFFASDKKEVVKKEEVDTKPDISISSGKVEELPSNLVVNNTVNKDLPPPTPPKVPDIKFDSSKNFLFSGGDKKDEELESIIGETQDAGKKSGKFSLFGDEEEEVEEVAMNPERLRAGFFIYGSGSGGGTSTTSLSGQTDSLTSIPETGAAKATASRIIDMDNTIAQGKMINTILETAINSDLPGMLRAIVTRDVYAESGKNILIPKGSRVIGTYNSSVVKGQKRLLITWGRVILPNGVDIQIDSPGTDQFGRSGVTGDVDNKYWEILSSSALLSIITFGSALAANSVSDSDTTTTTNTDGSTSTTADASVTAITSMSDQLTSAAMTAVDQAFNLAPTITINQGTRITVFVNKDLVIPVEASNSTNVNFIK